MALERTGAAAASWIAAGRHAGLVPRPPAALAVSNRRAARDPH
jgi:hypothetical protein